MDRPRIVLDELTARGQRVDDPAGREDAEHPPHPHLPAGDIHGDLGELGTERSSSFCSSAPTACGVSDAVVPARNAAAGRARLASVTATLVAKDQERVPIEPPAIIAKPKSLSAMRIRMRSGATSSASAAAVARVRAVRAPVPMSDAVIRR